MTDLHLSQPCSRASLAPILLFSKPTSAQSDHLRSVFGEPCETILWAMCCFPNHWTFRPQLSKTQLLPWVMRVVITITGAYRPQNSCIDKLVLFIIIFPTSKYRYFGGTTLQTAHSDPSSSYSIHLQVAVAKRSGVVMAPAARTTGGGKTVEPRCSDGHGSSAHRRKMVRVEWKYGHVKMVRITPGRIWPWLKLHSGFGVIPTIWISLSAITSPCRFQGRSWIGSLRWWGQKSTPSRSSWSSRACSPELANPKSVTWCKAGSLKMKGLPLKDKTSSQTISVQE